MKFISLIVPVSLGVAAPALACSPASGYRIPSNVELIEKADLVVLAQVTTGPDMLGDSTGEDIFEPRVVLMPVRAIKGNAPAQLRVFGYLKAQDGKSFSSSPTSLNKAHPSAFWGACIRQAYSPGSLVVAMFKRSSDGYVQIGDPFARAVEDVSGPSAIWVRAADDYSKLVSGTDTKNRRSAFKAERKRLLSLSHDADAKLIAADIGTYLDRVHESK